MPPGPKGEKCPADAIGDRFHEVPPGKPLDDELDV
jgi:hypothetical protein